MYSKKQLLDACRGDDEFRDKLKEYLRNMASDEIEELTGNFISQEAQDFTDRMQIIKIFMEITETTDQCSYFIDKSKCECEGRNLEPFIDMLKMAGLHWCRRPDCSYHFSGPCRQHCCGISSVGSMLVILDGQCGRYATNEYLLRIMRKYGYELV